MNMQKNKTAKPIYWFFKLFPLLTLCATWLSSAIGLSIRAEIFPGIDNIVFIMLATAIIGLAPFAVLIGFLPLVLFRITRMREKYLLIIACIILVALIVPAYFLGAELDF